MSDPHADAAEFLIFHDVHFVPQIIGMIEITIIDDDIVEFLEIFSVTLLSVTGARLGEDVQVTVAIPPNDSPVGLFGFEEKHVSMKGL